MGLSTGPCHSTAKHRCHTEFCSARRGGFTLVEMMVSLTITALLVVSVVSATRALGRTREAVDVRIEREDCARRAMEAIMAGLRNVRRDPVEREPVIVGRHRAANSLGQADDRIDLLVIDDQRVRDDGAESDQYEMSFQLSGGTAGRLPALVCRKDHALDDHPDEGGKVHLIAENIVGLRLEYRKGDVWEPEWDPLAARPPEAVRVTVLAASPPTPDRPKMEMTSLTTIVPTRIQQPAGENRKFHTPAEPKGGPP